MMVPILKPSWQLRAGESFKGLIPEQRLTELDVPVFVVHGSADTRVPIEEGRRLARVSGGSMRVVDEAGHTDVLGTPSLRAHVVEALASMV